MHLIIGDFNKSCIKWSSANFQNFFTPSNFRGEIPDCLIQNMAFSNLEQFNGIANHQKKLLDLVLSNVNQDDITVVLETDPISVVDAYHPPLDISINIDKISFLNERTIDELNYYKANYHIINDKLGGIDWDLLLVGNVNEMTNKFYNAIFNTIDKLVPKKNKRKGGHPVYFSQELIKVLNKKEKVRVKYKRFGLMSDYDDYSLLRRKARSVRTG